MGLSADAYLIWGIPVVAYTDEWDDERDEPKATPFWDADEEYWREFDGLEIHAYGHYQDPDNQRAILTHPSIPRFSGDCWDPGRVGDRDLDVESYYDDAVHEFMARVIEIDEGLVGERGWYLVASYG